MFYVQIAVVLLLQGISLVLGQFGSFNNFDSNSFNNQGQQAQFQQGFQNNNNLGQQFQQQDISQFLQNFNDQGQQFQQQQINNNQIQQGQFQQQQPIRNTNEGNPRTRPPGNLGTTTAIPPPTTTTAQPGQVIQCRQNCPITSEYNPVCGTDGQSYNNMNALRCARSCGVGVGLDRVGPCIPRRV